MYTTHFIRLAIVLLSACSLWSCQSQQEQASAVATERLQFRVENLQRTSDDCSPDSSTCARLHITYPVATAGPAALRQSINHYVQQRLQLMRYDFGPDADTSATSYTDAAEKLANLFFEERQRYKESTQQMPDPPHPGLYGWELQVKGQPLYVSARVVSLLFDNFTYLGGAHGNPTRILQSFDSTGHLLSLPEMVNDTVKLQALAEQQFRQVRKEMVGDMPLSEAGLFITGNTLPLPQNYALTAEGLQLYYNPYEIGPYAMGATELLLPYNFLKGLLRPAYFP
ncbi:DUF3298 and DUF4163 domain-containing protein [Pontibacter sp. SGAir0037]|uniref:DUF3298 and DUF4163 domain-containing protein n=1 Tax=Pontibacter sp. SGAir0037 TaxID=2571030 RepID=UPI0010CCD574|nr:DUF3298 and DUF4163 domain-containing protein [Pontibacter sp. SGAir0037]QCR23157.1 hypothetical protein C1N53_12925 [Pontibacter sp. SGAir0037]